MAAKVTVIITRMGNLVSEQSQILISTSDVDFYLLMDHVLQTQNLEAFLVTEPQEIQRVAAERRPGLILQDQRRGMLSAVEVYQKVQESNRTSNIPFLVLIGADVPGEQVRLLKSGIDEIITRPVSPDKLLDRIGILLGSSRHKSSNSIVSYADVEMDLDKHLVKRNGREIHLGPTEYRLLQHLLEHPGKVFSRADLINAAWPSNVYVLSRTVDVHMGRLRKALKEASDKDLDLIRTVRSVGYGIAD